MRTGQLASEAAGAWPLAQPGVCLWSLPRHPRDSGWLFEAVGLGLGFPFSFGTGLLSLSSHNGSLLRACRRTLLPWRPLRPRPGSCGVYSCRPASRGVPRAKLRRGLCAMRMP